MQSTAEGLAVVGEKWAALQVLDDNDSNHKVRFKNGIKYNTLVMIAINCIGDC